MLSIIFLLVVWVIFQRQHLGSCFSRSNVLEKELAGVLSSSGIDGSNDEDVVIVGTVDGYIHAISNNNEKWKIDTGGPFTGATHSVGNDKEYTVVPSLDGSILLHTQKDGMRKTSVKARMIAEKAPFTTEDGLIFTGSKSSKVIGIDMRNGKLLHDSSVDGRIANPPVGLRSLVNDKMKSPLWLGRVDYTVRAFDKQTGNESFNITFSELKTLDNNFVSHRRPQDQRGLIKSGESVEISKKMNHLTLIANPDSGDLCLLDANGANYVGLGSPAITAFVVKDNQENTIDTISVGGNSDYEVQSLKIGYRMSKFTSDEIGRADDEPMVVVRSLPNGAIYAMELNPEDRNAMRKAGTYTRDLPPKGFLPPPDAHSPPTSSPSSLSQSPLSNINDEEFELNMDVDVDIDVSINEATDAQKDSEDVAAQTFLKPLDLKLPPHRNRMDSILSLKGSKATPSKHRLPLSLHSTGKPASLTSEASGPENILKEKFAGSDDGGSDNDLGGAILGGARDRDEKNFLSGRGRLCSAYLDSFNSDGDLVPRKVTIATMLPTCLEGNHRLLPLVSQRDQFGDLLIAKDPNMFDHPQFAHISNYVDDSSDMDLSGGGLPSRKTPLTLLAQWVRFIETLVLRIALALFLGFAVLYWLNRYGIGVELAQTLLKTALEMVLGTGFALGKSSSSQSTASALDSLGPEGSPALNAQSATTKTEEVDSFGRKVTRIGSLALWENVLGYGSHGTVVLRGSLNGRPVAVKRMLSQFSRAAEREISLLIRSDGHPNVVRYFLREVHGDFVYLALQLCKMSMRDFVLRLQRSNQLQRARAQAGNDANGFAALSLSSVSSARGIKPQPLLPEDIPDEARRALLQAAEGLAHLHSQRIVHRDIKPHNILCAYPDDASITADDINGDSTAEIVSLKELGNYVLKISDMGLSKQLDREEGSFASMSMPSCYPQQAGEPSVHSTSTSSTSANLGMDNTPVGTIGWQAPELMALRGTGLTLDDEEDKSTKDGQSEDIDGEERDTSGNEMAKGSRNVDDDCEGMDDASSSQSIDAPGTKTFRDHGNGSGHTREGSGDNPRGEGIPPQPRARKSRKTQNVDIFSLGCVFHYTLIPGVHPFGQWYEREANIMLGRSDLSNLKMVPDARDLLLRMLQREPEDRPSAVQVCHHPFFWSTQRRLDFLVELSDRLEHESADSAIVLAIEVNASAIVGRSWDRKLFSGLLEDMGRYRKYDTASVRDLLRVMRNKRHHYYEMDDKVKEVVPLNGFVSYFENLFPRLLMHCVEVACSYLSKEKDFLPYCSHIAPLFSSKMGATKNSSAVPIATGSQKLAISQPTELPHESSHLSGRSIETMDANQSVVAHIEASIEDGNIKDVARGVDSSVQDGLGQAEADLKSSTEKIQIIADGVDRGSEAPMGGLSQAYQDLAQDVIIWQGSALAGSLDGKGWWRDQTQWCNGSSAVGVGGKRSRPSHLVRSSTDAKYRSRLCTHWEQTGGGQCPMRKKGKCDFAHGPLELRVKESRRDKWGVRRELIGAPAGEPLSLRLSDKEDVLGAARSIEKVRVAEGSISEFEKTFSGAKKVSGGAGGGMSKSPHKFGGMPPKKSW